MQGVTAVLHEHAEMELLQCVVAAREIMAMCAAALAGLTSIAVHAESAVVVTGSEDCSGRLVNIQTGKVLGALNGEPGPLRCAVHLCCSHEHRAQAEQAKLCWFMPPCPPQL